MPCLTARLHVQVQLDTVCTVWCDRPSCHLGQQHVGLRRRVRAIRADHANGKCPRNTQLCHALHELLVYSPLCHIHDS